MLRMWGWRGGGIGREEQGRETPVETPRAAPKRDGQPVAKVTFVKAKTQAEAPAPQEPPPKTKGNKKYSKLRAVLTACGNIRYGYPNRDGLAECEITTKGAVPRSS